MTLRKNIFPATFARYLDKRWDNLVAGPDAERPPKPPPAVLRQVIEVAYLASMAVDEGRPLAFTLCSSPKGADPMIWRAPEHVLHYMRFQEHRPLIVEEIRKLGVATDRDASAIWTVWDGDSEAEISGLLNFTGNWASSRRVQSAEFGALPHALSVRALGPGRLQVYEGNYFLGELRNGSIVKPSTVSLFDALGAHEAANAGLDDLRETVVCPKYEYVKEWHEYEFLAWFNALFAVVNAIQDQRHGGAIVVLPTSQIDDSLLRVKYLFDGHSQPLRTALVDHLNRRHEWGDLYALVYEMTEGDILDPLPTKRTLSRRLKTAGERSHGSMVRLIEAAKFVGLFSGADGAIILTRTFEIVGFGAEITAEVPSGTRFMEVHDPLRGTGRECDVSQFGMRHRSALRVCAAFPDALALVISQDGDVSLVWSKDGGVRIKRHLNTTNANMVLA